MTLGNRDAGPVKMNTESFEERRASVDERLRGCIEEKALYGGFKKALEMAEKAY